MIESGIFLAILLGFGFIVRKMLRDAGVLKSGVSKSGDCGCGKCATKPRRHR